MKVLVAEDDRNILAGIKDVLLNEGYQVFDVDNGLDALAVFDAESPDFVCLDIMMPGMNGYDVCRALRKRNDQVPIIFLSAKSEEIDKVLGLELGADDYIMKPFGIKEFIARVRAVSRRCFQKRENDCEMPSSVVMAGLRVFPRELRAKRASHTIELSLREVQLLLCLHEHVGQALRRDDLFRAAWGGEPYPNSRTLDQHISKLRKKIEVDPKTPKIIRTVHGVGYRFDDP